MLLQNKVAVVTGANRGIGAAIVELFSENGANIIACARTQSREFAHQCECLQEKYGNVVVPLVCDLLDPESVKDTARQIASKWKTVHIMVNNAGIASGGLFQMTSIEKVRDVFEVNFFAPFVLSQTISRLMAKSGGGAIVNIASTAGLIGDPGTAAYGSSKAALLLLTKVMAIELGRYNIRVNAVAPSITKTEMLDQMEPCAQAKILASSAMKRPGEPLEVANGVLFLCSDLSSFVTGHVLNIDGGQR